MVVDLWICGLGDLVIRVPKLCHSNNQITKSTHNQITKSTNNQL